MAPNRLGVYWGDEEVDLLLEIMLDMGAGEVVMPSGRLQNAELFSGAARRLTAGGFPRSWEQCRAKFKRLKASFFEVLEKWDGVPPRKRRPPFFQPLFRLWEQAKRPSWLDRRAAVHFPVFRWRQEERERAMKEAESEHRVSSTDSQQGEKNTDEEAGAEENIEESSPGSGNVGNNGDNTQVEATFRREDDHPSNPDNSFTVSLEKGEDEAPQMEMVSPSPPQENSSIDNLMTVKEEDEAPQMEMALPTESAAPFVQGPVMFVNIPCTATVVSSSAHVEQSNRATQTLPAEDMYCKVEKLELSLHQTTTQITRLEQEMAQRENSHHARLDRLEKESEKMHQEIRRLQQCLQKFSRPSKERRQL